jgi:DNA primase
VVDRFRDRLMFPVRDPGGQRVVGFLGRALAEAKDTPRYLNSPATALYRKGEVLYGLGAEPVRRALAGGARPVLVEGPLDAIAVTAAGAGRYAGAAPCGTALTAAQVAVLDTHAGPLAERGIVAAFDHDPGGRQAALRAYELLAATDAWPGPPPPPCPKGRTPPPSPSTADRRHCAPPWTPPPHRWRTSSWTSGWPAGPTGCTGSKGSSAPPATPPD